MIMDAIRINYKYILQGLEILELSWLDVCTYAYWIVTLLVETIKHRRWLETAIAAHVQNVLIVMSCG